VRGPVQIPGGHCVPPVCSGPRDLPSLDHRFRQHSALHAAAVFGRADVENHQFPVLVLIAKMRFDAMGGAADDADVVGDEEAVGADAGPPEGMVEDHGARVPGASS